MKPYNTKEECSSHNSDRILLPLPDVRKVAFDQQNSRDTKCKEVVSSGNTTIIGDHFAATFQQHDRKWLVQATGNATFQSTLLAIQEGTITLDRHYIFIVISHNQLQMAKNSQLGHVVEEFLKLIRSKNVAAKIFINALLPRPVDNDTAKPLIVKFNRILAMTVNKVQKADNRIILLPVQHRFIKDSAPRLELFNQDLFTLNKHGAALLKASMFELAGFIKNA